LPDQTGSVITGGCLSLLQPFQGRLARVKTVGKNEAETMHLFDAMGEQWMGKKSKRKWLSLWLGPTGYGPLMLLNTLQINTRKVSQ